MASVTREWKCSVGSSATTGSATIGGASVTGAARYGVASSTARRFRTRPGSNYRIDQEEDRQHDRAVASPRHPVIGDGLRRVVFGLELLDVGLCAIKCGGGLRRRVRCVGLGDPRRVLRGLERCERARSVVAHLAHFGVAIEDEEKDGNEDNSVRAAQIEAVDAEKSRRQPEQIRDERRGTARQRLAQLPAHQVERHQRKEQQSGPVEPVRHDEGQ
jgi:hypothetical protein